MKMSKVLDQYPNIPEAENSGDSAPILVIKVKQSVSYKAVLYIHGFDDYVFQDEMATEFNDHNYHFYALNLRKGANYSELDSDVLSSYFTEILRAIEQIRNDGNCRLLLAGHSTGGLIATLFAQMYDHLIDGLWLNSPFFEFNKCWVVRQVLIPTVAFLGRYMPKMTVPGGLLRQYGINMHKSEEGEWEYNLSLKPHIPTKISMGWIRTIHRAHKHLNKGVILDIPVLMVCSSSMLRVQEKSEKEVRCSEIPLNVEAIVKKGQLIDADMKMLTIDNGIDDLVLSARQVRNRVYRELFGWMNEKIVE